MRVFASTELHELAICKLATSPHLLRHLPLLLAHYSPHDLFRPDAFDHSSAFCVLWADVLVNVQVNSHVTRMLGLAQHVCELQLILKDFMLQTTLEGHKRYVKFRNLRCK
jgi:hypothetical protein